MEAQEALNSLLGHTETPEDLKRSQTTNIPRPILIEDFDISEVLDTRNPDPLFFILADYLEERGNVLCYAYRFIAINKYFPDYHPYTKTWDWWSHQRRQPSNDYIYKSLFECLDSYDLPYKLTIQKRWWRGYFKIENAYKDLANAVETLRNNRPPMGVC